MDKKKLKSIDFYKMSERKYDDRVLSPHIGMYNPQYDSIINRLKDLNLKKNKKKVSKSKILSKFRQTINYQMVKF